MANENEGPLWKRKRPDPSSPGGGEGAGEEPEPTIPVVGGADEIDEALERTLPDSGAEPTLPHGGTGAAPRAPSPGGPGPGSAGGGPGGGTVPTRGAPTAPMPTQPSPTVVPGTAPGGAAVRPGKEPSFRRQVLAGRFELLALIGEGGMGRVYRVRDRQIPDRNIALKVLNARYSKLPRFRELFFQEIRAAQAFVDEHVNQVRDTGQTEDGRLYLTMDLVRGESLRELLKRENSLHERHALEIARQVLLGLQSGHEQGLIHRDVKPENVMLASRVPKTNDNPYGVGVRLLDFGLAGLAQEVTKDGQVAGTPMYMSPEQAQGQRSDARSDLFAVGVILYEMIAGSRPFHGKTVDNIITSVIETDVTPLIDELEHLSKPVRKILTRALEKRREDRFQSAAEFIQAIEGSAAYTMPSGVPTWTLGIGALLLVAAGGLGFLWFKEQARADRLQSRVDAGQDEMQAKITDLTSQLNARQAELETERAKVAELSDRQVETGTRADTELGDLKGRVTALEEKERDQRAEITRLIGDIDRQKQELIQKQQMIDAQTLQLSKLQQLQALEDERRNPVIRAALGTDRVLKRLEAGLGDKARAAFYSMAGEEAFAVEELPGGDFLEAFVEAGAALADHAAATDDFERAQALRAAQRHMLAAQGARAAFATLAEDWLGYRPVNGEPTDRLARIDALLAGFREVLDAAAASDASAHGADWARIADGDPLAVSRDALRHALEFQCEHVGEFLESYAAALHPAVLRDGGIDPEGLAGGGSLAEWSEFLAEERASLDRPGGRDVLLYGYAQRWYDAKNGNDALDWSVVGLGEPDALGAANVPEWVVQLRLRHALAQPSSAFPNVPGGTLVYRTVRPDKGTVLWEIETLEEAPELGPDHGTWRIRLDLRQEDGNQLTKLQAKTLQRFGKIFRFEGSVTPLIDLGRVEDVAVDRFESDFQGSLPPQLPLDASDLARYRAALAGDDVRCLVIEGEGVTRWISPVYGLVRETNLDPSGAPNKIKELVFASQVR